MFGGVALGIIIHCAFIFCNHHTDSHFFTYVKNLLEKQNKEEFLQMGMEWSIHKRIHPIHKPHERRSDCVLYYWVDLL